MSPVCSRRFPQKTAACTQCSNTLRWSPASRQGQGKWGSHRKATNSLHFARLCFKCDRVAIICVILPYLVAFCTYFPVKVHHWELRHFCDDPVYPVPVWKLLKEGCAPELAEMSILWNTPLSVQVRIHWKSDSHFGNATESVNIHWSMPLNIYWNMSLNILSYFIGVDFWCAILCR